MAVNVHTALALVRSRLNRLPGDTSLDDQLTARIMAAAKRIERRGIRLDDSIADTLLVVDLAVWMYQSRDQQTGEPDWLRQQLRERWLQQHDP